MQKLAIALISGLLFGFGLSLSGMTDPSRVIGFLDITGYWDPTLAFVMGSALLTTSLGYRLILKMPQPIFSSAFSLPTKKNLDTRLITGSIIFGIGWGLIGICPGPAIALISSGSLSILLLVAAIMLGIFTSKQLT